MPRLRRIKPTRTRIDQILEDSRLIRTQAQALNAREQLWELHGVLRQRAAEDVMLRWCDDQRSERIGSSLAARRAGM
jgi:hypothetical protein